MTASDERDTKSRLLEAGEHLFARHGIHAVRNRELNALAGQRNQSALHYHFGSRQGLVDAILHRHQREVDEEISAALDRLEAQPAAPTVRQLVDASVHALAVALETPSGRNFLRIVPQVLGSLERNLRSGGDDLGTTTSDRVLRSVAGRLGHLPPRLRRERMVAYVVVLSALFAEQAQAREGGTATLRPKEFVRHAGDVLEAVLTAGAQPT